MLIPFNLSTTFDRSSDETENACVLRALLDCLIRCNVARIRYASRPLPRLYESGVKYGRTIDWDNVTTLYKRGYGDCKSLTAALIAEYYLRGIDARPVFRHAKTLIGARNYHILVLVPKRNGLDKTEFEDPSRKLGMGQDELKHFY